MTEIKTANVPTTANKASKTNALADAKKMNFSTLIKGDKVQKSIESTLGDATKAKTFTASLISAVNTNPTLQECDGISVISAALVGESLNLSPSPQLGMYYMVPFDDRKENKKKAQFILSWRGLYQLALRSGQYKNIDVVSVKRGELKKHNPITGEIDLDPITDPEERENAETIGFYAYFEMLNGFTKRIYWSVEKMRNHAIKYSKGYASDLKNKTQYTYWSKDFDSMAYKTMIKQLLKFGVLSVEMQSAMSSDESTVTIDKETGEVIEDSNTFDAEYLEV